MICMLIVAQQVTISRDAALQVILHRLACRTFIPIHDGPADRVMFLGQMPVVILRAHVLLAGLQFPPGDDADPDEGQEFGETGVVRCLGDGQMEIEIGVPCRTAVLQTGQNRVMGGHDPLFLLRRTAQGGKARALHLHRAPQFQQLDHRRHLAQIEVEERPRLRLQREDSGPLARLHQPLEGQGGDRLAHHRATDAVQFRQLDFGRQTLPRLYTPSGDLGPQSVGNPGGKTIFHAGLPNLSYISYIVRVGMANISEGCMMAYLTKDEAMTRTTARTGNLVERVSQALRAEIAEGRLKPGDRLPSEARLTEAHGVSRTVVREAVAALRADRLVEARQGAGVFVLEAMPVEPAPFQNIDYVRLSSVIEMLELRTAVEVEAAGLAATRRSAQQEERILDAFRAVGDAIASGQPTTAVDYDLHLAIAEATNNPRFTEFLALVGSQVIPRHAIERSEAAPATYLSQIQDEHDRIVTAILGGDGEGARDAMRVHLRGSQSRYRALLRG